MLGAMTNAVEKGSVKLILFRKWANVFVVMGLQGKYVVFRMM